MPKKNNVADSLDIPDLEVALGDVYLGPQALEDYEHEATAGLDPEEKKEAKRTKALAYKAKLLFSGEGAPVGQFRAVGTRVCTRIYFDVRDNWTSCIRIEVKAFVRTPSPAPDRPAEEELVHRWVVRMTVACDLSTESELHIYPKAFLGRKEDDYLEKAYIEYCINVKDETAKQLRAAGQLGYVSFSLAPGQAHTEGILHERSILGGFQSIQDQLYRVFTQPDDQVVRLTALFAVSEEKAFHVALAGIRDAFELERAHPPYTRWFNGLADAKAKVQKGQVTPRADRPPVTLPFSLTYANSNDCWTAEGMSIIIQEENDIQDAKDAQGRECKLRVLKVTPGGDRLYIGLLRLPDGFEYRFSADDAFLVDLGDEKAWSASILPKPFPFASSLDYTIALKRPLDDNKEYSKFEIESVFDLSGAVATSPPDIEEFYFNGNFTKVKVVPVLSDKPYKFRMAAIKTLNPAHQEDKRHVHNPRWETLILGQDLRTKTTCDLFEGIDVAAQLQQWGIQLDTSQMETLKYLTQMPNNLGIVKGPWGTGKTKVDVVVTMLLMSTGKKVKVLSPTNKAADSFIVKLNEEIARLKDKGITITDKHIVRFHSPTTEQAVVKVDTIRYRTRDTSDDRWQSQNLLACQYDRIAAEIVEQARHRAHGVSDVRYKLHDASFGTLLLQVADLLHRTPPLFGLTPRSNAPQATEAGDGSSDTAEAGDGVTLSNSDGEEVSENEVDDGDAESIIDGDYHHTVGATYEGPTSKAAQEQQQTVQNPTQQKLDEARGLTHREKLCADFREMFLKAEKNTLGKDEWEAFEKLERFLSEDILSNDVAVLASTLVNSGHSIVKNHFKGDHVIVQEANKSENGDVFIAFANCETSVHMSGDNAQLPPKEQDIARNPFAQQTNKSMYHRWVSLGYPISELTEQHRTIPAISDVLSTIWYKGAVVSKVDPSVRPNARMAIAAHQALFNVTRPITWIHTDGESHKMGFSQSSQNERELQVAIKLCQMYTKHGIQAKDIVILAGYLAQIGLTKRALALTPGLQGVDASTIDAYQGEEKPVVILCFVGCGKLGFMSEGPRILSGLSRAGDALAIITNYVGIRTSEHKRKRNMYEQVRYLIGRPGHATYDAPLPDLNLVMHDHDLLPDDGQQRETGEDGNGEGFGPFGDDGEDASMQHGTGEGGNGEGSDPPPW